VTFLLLQQAKFNNMSVFTLQSAIHIELLKKEGGISSKFLVKAIILPYLSQKTSALVCNQSMVIVALF
jgi:hypothetical protein